MRFIQELVTDLLPHSWADSIRAESEGWMMRCPCGAETSVWEMGGVRFKAAGQPTRWGRCRECRAAFRGPVYWNPQGGSGSNVAVTTDVTRTDVAKETGRTAQTQTATTMTPTQPISMDPETAPNLLLWVDGVGTWFVSPRNRVVIGGQSTSGREPAADLTLMADLSRQHASILRVGEGYLLEARGRASVAGRPVAGRSPLYDGNLMELGESVKIQFRRPNALSPTAVLDLRSGHRPARNLSGVVLMDQVLLLGSKSDQHIPCGDWTAPIVLFRKEGRLWCRSRGELTVDGVVVQGAAPVYDGSVIAGEGGCFRVEAVAGV